MAGTEGTTESHGSVLGTDVPARVASQAGNRGRRRDRGEETFVITHDLLEGLANQRQDRLATVARQRHTLPATTRRTRERRPLSALAAWVNRA